ncbi:MAG: hypothetical protein K2Y37_20770, partial [Pirellulales bacterium]|nr:hypothetical protein [Pirellulales bacterium]
AGPRRAAVSALGLGGTNAHVILEAASADVATSCSGRSPKHAQEQAELFTISARTQTALQSIVDRYIRWINENPNAALGDICFTTNAGRSQLPARWAAVATSLVELRTKLTELLATRHNCCDETGSNYQPLRRPRTALLCTDVSDCCTAGKQFYVEVPEFRAAIKGIALDARAEHRQEFDGALFELRRFGSLDEAQTRRLQNFAFQVGLIAVWTKWGVTPTAIMGTGTGELAARYAADETARDQALKMVLQGAKLEGLSGFEGAAIRVFTSSVQVAAFSAGLGQIAISSLNLDECIAIGAKEQVGDLRRALEAAGVRVVTVFEGTNLQLKGNNEIEPVLVRFEQAGADVVLEIGSSGETLANTRQAWEARGRLWTASLDRNLTGGVRRQLLTTLGRLYFSGVEVDWQRFYQFSKWRRLALPTYPFEHERYWVEVVHATAEAQPDQPRLTDSQASSRTATETHYALHPLLDECLSFDGAEPGSCAS